MNTIKWAREYGDEDHWGRFAGRFVGYDARLISPSEYIYVDKPVVLLLADSIFGGEVWQRISYLISNHAKLSYIQHPHHAGSINKWLDKWEIEKWKHYRLLFNFEGLHGFPPRQTIESHFKNTIELVKRYKKTFPIIIWGNMTPISLGFKTGNLNSEKGPNSIEQEITDEIVCKMNENLKQIMDKESIPLVDIYSLIKENQTEYQLYDDLHLTIKGKNKLAELVATAIIKEMK